MTSELPDLSAFLNPHLCANTEQKVDVVIMPRTKDAALACSGCIIVQISDWKRHKATCRSPFLKDTWQPAWFTQGRVPSFIGDGTHCAMFGATKYLWGNMPALDILQIKQNEGTADAVTRNFNLLFAASGDLRNVIKTISGLPAGYKGDCVAVINDKGFVIAARNAITLLLALHLDPETADVCGKIDAKPSDSFQAKTFDFHGRKLRLVLQKEQWIQLPKFCQRSQNMTTDEAQMVRRRIMLAPERIDFRHRGLLHLPKSVRQGETHFRYTGVFLPYGCSTHAFNVANPTLFSSKGWALNDSSNPRGSWLHAEYMADAPAAKGDEFGAIFFHVRKLLIKFCKRIRDSNVSFHLFSMDARKLSAYVGAMKFDRIEISNICDSEFIGLQASLEAFSGLLKPKSQNATATLLMLFINAATHMNRALNPEGGKNENKYHPRLVFRSTIYGMFINWDKYFDIYLDSKRVCTLAASHGLQAKLKHTIVQPWPMRIRVGATKQEFDVACANMATGYERYMEFENLD
ncbi:hypothetical protein BDW02DRAFT_604401 [Decorospora gaudefroyi]|uniref:DUF4470 domain-containing protein n=1 Tax=Decorospora gaudefroyi TaxID=184978 RepID=A0A6A5KR78_9PLEO|nr:hypothetical protein BDW02DRAFT_604401 [Decorospora gaudefroyi]